MAQKRFVGETAPEFELNNLDGNLHRLSETRGRIVLLVFWSADCPWVERVDLALQPLLSAWGGAVQYLPVAANANESPLRLREAAGARGLPLPWWDERGRAASLYAAQITPEFFILDPAGIVRYQGAFDDINFRQRTPTRCYVQEVVEALLSGQTPQTDFTAPYGCAIVNFGKLIA